MKKLILSLLLVGSISMAEVGSEMQAAQQSEGTQAAKPAVESPAATPTSASECEIDAQIAEVGLLKNKRALLEIVGIASITCSIILGAVTVEKIMCDDRIRSEIAKVGLACILFQAGAAAYEKMKKIKAAYYQKLYELKKLGIHLI